MPLYASFPLGSVPATPSAPTVEQSWASGSTRSDWTDLAWTMPSAPTIQVGDRVVLFGVSRQDVAANKTMTTPSGFTLGANYTTADNLCDVRWVHRTVTEGDLTSGASYTFGENSRRIDWLIVRNYSGTTTTGAGASSFSSPLTVPTIAGTESGGVHVVSFTASGENPEVTSVPSGYVTQYTPPMGWSGGGLWIKSPSDRPTGDVDFAATASNYLGLTGLSFWIYPGST